MATSLWGKLPPADSVRAPAAILREQAAALGEATNNVLQGEVRTYKAAPSKLNSTLDIVAPALDNYRHTVLTISHGVELYPVRLLPADGTGWAQYEAESEFVAAVSDVLQSEHVRRIVASLLAQSHTGWAA